VVTSLSVGASALMSGDGRVINGAGDPNACAQASNAGPNPGCAAPLQVSLMKIPGRGPQEPPPGLAQVEVVSEFPDQVWDVYNGEDRVCTTPCTQWLDPLRPLYLESRDADRDRLWLSSLAPGALESRNALLVATGTHEGKQVNGIVFTSLGGMGVIVGISLTAIGCTDPDLGGMCTAGLITGGVSLPLTGLAILLILDSLPKAEVIPVLKPQPGRAQLPFTIGLSPTGIAGTF
jgi:hypothetical protein